MTKIVNSVWECVFGCICIADVNKLYAMPCLDEKKSIIEHVKGGDIDA